MRASAGGHSSNAQPEAARSSFWRAAADWAMMETQARRVSAIQHDQVRSGFLSRCSYVAPSPQRRSPATWPRKELTYCPIYGFKPSVICTKDLTRELFCCLRFLSAPPNKPKHIRWRDTDLMRPARGPLYHRIQTSSDRGLRPALEFTPADSTTAQKGPVRRLCS